MSQLRKVGWLCACVLIAVLAAWAASWFTSGQDANLMLSGVDFNNSGGPLLYNHPTGIASDGTHFLLCDRFNNRVLVWNTLPTAWDAMPDLVLGQPDFIANNPGTSKSEMNWPGNVSVSSGGVVAVADTENDRVLLWKQFPTKTAQPADISISLRTITPTGTLPYDWPWGIWTDGTKLVALATSGTLLFWKSLPAADDQSPDYTIKLPEFGTPRNISTDGSTYFFVGDHNSGTNHDKAGTFFWNSFPTTANQPFDFYTDSEGWIKGIKLSDGRLVAGGLASIFIWKTFPTSSSQRPDLTISNSYYSNGDGPDVVYAGGRLYVINYNGNNVQVYDGVPSSTTDQPSFALGSSSISFNTLNQINYIQNPVLATDGTRLVASSDFDSTLWIWKSFPTRSGAPPDVQISLKSARLNPWGNALYGGRLVLAGKQDVAVWDSLPLNGEEPSRVFRKQIGTATFQKLQGVALDSSYFYLVDEAGTIYVWNQVPATDTENPFRVITSSSSKLGRARSDGTYLCVASPGPPSVVYVYRVADIAGTGSIQPYKTIGSFLLNLAAEAMTFDGAIAIADTSNNRVLLWRSLDDTGDTSKAIILGQSSLSLKDPATGIMRLFMPASLVAEGSNLWVGEFKFSSRILRFSYGTVTLNRVPTLTSLSPSSRPAGTGAFTLTAKGSGFISGSVVRWKGLDRATTFVSDTELTASISASDMAASGTASVSVFTPSPGGGTSSALTFTIDKSAPLLDITLSKSSYVDGDTVTATTFRVANPASSATAVHLRIWLKVPTVGEVTLVDIGADGTFALPPNVDANAGPIALITVTASFPPKGSWEFDSRMKDPATGALLSEDINSFEIK